MTAEIEDPVCECDHLEDRHLIDDRADAGDFCLDTLWDEELKMDVSCLCKKFMLKGSVPEEQPRKSPNYEEDE